MNCSEGTNWQDKKGAVVRILVKDGNDEGWCTGTLINNTLQNCSPYILSAGHCEGTASASDLGFWTFYFNYESPDCNEPSSEGTLGDQILTGATKLAFSNDGGGDTGSDFLLLLLNDTVPKAYNAFYAGWNRSNVPAFLGVSIHHPLGDIKKISTFSTPVIDTSYGGVIPSTHWSVTWEATTNGHGVTESGSSGSPIFNENGYVVGTETGGLSFCDFPDDPDNYGKMSYHWSSNGTVSENRLKDWLDPTNTGAFQLSGLSLTCGSDTDPTSIENTKGQQKADIYPNPTEGIVTLTIPDKPHLVKVYDPSGRILKQYSVHGNHLIDLQEFTDGIYFIQVIDDKDVQVLKVIVQQP